VSKSVKQLTGVYICNTHISHFVVKESSNKHFIQVLEDVCFTNMQKTRGH